MMIRNAERVRSGRTRPISPLLRRYALPAVAGAVVVSLLAAGQRTPAGDGQNAPDAQVPPHIAAQMAAARGGGSRGQSELPKWDDVSEGFEQVVSTADGSTPMYNVWKRERDAQVLAELPRNYEQQLLFFAYTISGGIPTAGVQAGDRYLQWKRFDKRLALIEPNYIVRTTGDLESQRGRDRVFTDRVLLDIPITAEGPNGQPVINMTDLLIGQSGNFFGQRTRGANRNLAGLETVKSFPRNVELAWELPLGSGQLATLHYSISVIPQNTGYKPREADSRVGYFTTSYRDLGDPAAEVPWKRYINRWHLEKAEPSLRMSPPKEPIIFYIEHTTPIRYRRWVREGILEWNKAYEKVGISGAIEVRQQDARTGAYMDIDPADARYNFVLWTNAGMGFAIGPSRVDPRTGQILDADVVLDEGFISSWARSWRHLVPQMAMDNFGPETLAWLDSRPQWDPRVRLAPPERRADTRRDLQADRARRGIHRFAGHPAANVDSELLGENRYEGLYGRASQRSGMCLNGMMKSLDVALFRYSAELLLELADDEDNDEKERKENGEEENGGKADAEKPDPKTKPGELLDGMPEWFVGPLLRDLTMHEIGHTLGLRHNFKASGIFSVAEMNTPEHKSAGKTISGSVMDYNPMNVNFEDGPEQGHYSMHTIGPYDYWAIEYGYSFDRNLDPILNRVSEPELAYATDEDTWGPDPMARRFDLGDNPLDYTDSQMRLIHHLRSKIIERIVEEGDSWSKSRRAYEILLWRHFNALSIAANWVGGSTVHRDQKGDPGDRNPIENISADQQRRALKFVVDNAFDEAAFGLTPELLHKMTVDKWWDAGGFGDIFADPTWPVHDRIMGIQAASMTMIMNPTTLNRVFDNEYRIAPEEDAVTLPEIIFGVSDAVWSEIQELPSQTYSARKPLISSLRRNLQSEHLKRLIDLSLPNESMGAAQKAISNLAVFQLRQLNEKIDRIIDQRKSRLDPYSLAHLDEARVRIEKALEAQFIYNASDIGGGGQPMFLIIGEENAERINDIDLGFDLDW